MKRILLLLLLCLNLQIVTHGGIFIVLAPASAQTMQYEELGEVIITGELENCPNEGCNVRDCHNAIEEHRPTCEYRKVECNLCHVTYKYIEGHICQRQYVECPICRAQVLREDLESGRHTHEKPSEGSPSDGGGGGGGGGGSSGKHTDTQYEVLKRQLRIILNELSNMSPKLKINIEELESKSVFIFENDLNNPQYNPQDGKIHIPTDGTWTSAEGVSHEMIHYWQDQLGMLDYDRCSSNNELQAYFVNYLLLDIHKYDIELPLEFDGWNTDGWKKNNLYGLDSSGYPYYTDNLLTEIQKYGINHVAEIFYENSKNYSTSSSNGHSYNPNYNWNWAELLKSVGFIKK